MPISSFPEDVSGTLLGTAAALSTLLFVFLRKKSSSPRLRVRDFRKDTVYIFAYGNMPNGVQGSPFCMKAITFMKVFDIPYEVRHTIETGDKGKLPYAEYNGVGISDSALIIQHLVQERKLPQLTGKDRALETMVIRTCEDHLYHVIVYLRWIAPGSVIPVRENYFYEAPFPVRMLIPYLARRTTRANLIGHGLGRHALSDIVRFGSEDLEALSGLIGEREYISGDEPHLGDVVAYCWVWSILNDPMSELLRGVVDRQFPNLRRYAEKFHQRHVDV